MFKQVIYCSKLLPEYDLKEVYSILKKARETNPELGLSGYLIFGNDCFIQILEGFNAPLKMLMQKIMVDKRHTNIKVLQDEEIKFLEFQNWAMGFANLTEEFFFVTVLINFNRLFSTELTVSCLKQKLFQRKPKKYST